ncbi:PAS domain S-box-containing protein [Nitrosomonas sp. Nm33]|nr:PAS domain S-box-containing protein [Nitrosomonas sp. Nm33]
MRSDRGRYRFIKYLLIISIPLLLLLLVVLWLLLRAHEDANTAIMESNERLSVQLGEKTIDYVFATIRGDALYLAELSSLQQWLDTGDPAVFSRLTEDLLAFTQFRQLYDKARFMDEHGQEVVRINYNEGKPIIAPQEKLQNQFELDFVQKTLALGEKTVYVSPFEPTIEHGVIVHPIKPTIRFSVPVFDSKNQLRGLIVLNYKGDRLMRHLQAISDLSLGNLGLVNDKGNWLLEPHPAGQGGFMFRSQGTESFSDKFGEEIWSFISRESPIGQWMHEKGLFTYSRVNPSKVQNPMGGLNIKGSEEWILVSYIPSQIIAASTAEYSGNLDLAFIVLTILLLVLSGVFAHYVVQREKAEIKVRASEAQFRELLESAPEAIMLVDQTGCIALINSQTEKWFGYSRNELVGQSAEQLIPERYRKEHPITLQLSATTVAHPSSSGSELHGRRKDGSEFPIEISLSPLETEQGILITSIIRDISARKQAEEARQRVQARYRDLVNNLPMGVFRSIPDAKGSFLEINPAMVNIFEAESAEQLSAHSFSEFYCDPAERKILMGKVLLQGHVHGEEVRLRTLKGREFYAALTAVMKKDETVGIYFDGIVEDISVRKENERRINRLNKRLEVRSKELEAINRELEAFSYSVSHDLRTPLRAMDGFSRTLLDEYADQLDNRGRDRLQRIRVAAQRMAELIDGLLKLSRVTRAELKWEVVDLTLLANEILSTLEQMEPERSVQYSVQPSLIARGDKQLLRIMLDNLLSNAWKFTAQSQKAFIEVGCNVDEERIIYFVRDNGAGFDMAYADKLFGVFQRLHDTHEFPGTGIGLATVQRVIHKHGGQIWAESAIDQGATFYFTLDEKEIV